MCVKVKCATCGKPTWKGCGAHADQVLKDVPIPDRCACRELQPECNPDDTDD